MIRKDGSRVSNPRFDWEEIQFEQCFRELGLRKDDETRHAMLHFQFLSKGFLHQVVDFPGFRVILKAVFTHHIMAKKQSANSELDVEDLPRYTFNGLH